MSAIVLTNGEKQKQEKKKALKSAPTETWLCIDAVACVYVALLRAQIWMYLLHSIGRFQR